MMTARIYGFLWLLTALAGAILYFSGSFGTVTSLVLGFIVASLAGAGLLVVFPVLMAERVSTRN